MGPQIHNALVVARRNTARLIGKAGAFWDLNDATRCICRSTPKLLSGEHHVMPQSILGLHAISNLTQHLALLWPVGNP
jgi:hypothetical protein